MKELFLKTGDMAIVIDDSECGFKKGEHVEFIEEQFNPDPFCKENHDIYYIFKNRNGETYELCCNEFELLD